MNALQKLALSASSVALFTGYSSIDTSTTVVFTSDQFIASDRYITAAFTEWRCENGAKILFSANASVVVSGKMSVNGCEIVGAGIDAPTTPAFKVQSRWFSFNRNRVHDFGKIGIPSKGLDFDGGVVMFDGAGDMSDAMLKDNEFFDNHEMSVGIFPEPGSTIRRLQVVGNKMSNGLFSAPAGGSILEDWLISINQFEANNYGTPNGCLLLFGGGTAGNSVFTNINMTGNHCKLRESSNDSTQNAYGFGGLYKSSFVGNTYDANGKHLGPGAYIVEMNVVVETIIADNRVESPTGIEGVGIICEDCSGTTIKGNRVSGFGTTANSAGIMFLNRNATHSYSNDIVGNTVTMRPESVGAGISVVSNHPAALTQMVNIAENSVHNSGAAPGSRAISITNSYASSSFGFVKIGPNLSHGSQIGTFIGPNTGYFCYLPGYNDAAQPVVNQSGQASSCH